MVPQKRFQCFRSALLQWIFFAKLKYFILFVGFLPPIRPANGFTATLRHFVRSLNLLRLFHNIQINGKLSAPFSLFSRKKLVIIDLLIQLWFFFYWSTTSDWFEFTKLVLFQTVSLKKPNLMVSFSELYISLSFTPNLIWKLSGNFIYSWKMSIFCSALLLLFCLDQFGKLP